MYDGGHRGWFNSTDLKCFCFQQPPSDNDITVKKGTNPRVDCYSAFWDNGDCTQSTLFVDLLKRGVTDVYVCGLAFDVCVKDTTMDANSQGFKTHVLVDACRGVTSDGIEKAKEDFIKSGIILMKSDQVRKVQIISNSGNALKTTDFTQFLKTTF